MSGLRRLARPSIAWGFVLAVALAAFDAPAFAQPRTQPQGAPADNAPPPQGVSRGENFSAKPAPALFASDCTGSGCHKGPQGLGKMGQFGLANFLREHYTNSRQSAAALAAYLAGVPGAAASDPRNAKPQQQQQQPGTASRSRAAARSDDVVPPAAPGPAATPPASASPAASTGRQPRTGEASDGASSRQGPGAHQAQRGRQQAPAVVQPPAEPPPPPPPQFDIFD